MKIVCREFSVFLLFLMFFVVMGVHEAIANPDKETLYIDGFDSTYTEWETSGSSPYLDDSDSYIYDHNNGDLEGYFAFADTDHSGDVFNSVEIYFECFQAASGEWFEVWIYNGSSWSDMGDIFPDSSYSWKSLNVTSTIDSWTKVDACQLYVAYTKSGGSSYVYIRRCYLYVDYTAMPHDLNLRVLDWDLTDPIKGAVVYKDGDTQVSDVNGWANWTDVTGTVQIKVSYNGFWVNGSFPVIVGTNKTIDLRCKLYDVMVTVQETFQNALLAPANVSVFNTTSLQANRIATGVTNASGQHTFINLPNNTLTFTLYGGSGYSLMIGNSSQLVSSEDQSITLFADENYISASVDYSFIALIGSVSFFAGRRKR